MARPKERREDILISATEIFAAKGFHPASIVEIAENAGIGKGTVYEYFNSKNALFMEVLKYNIGKYYKKLESDLLSESTFSSKLNMFINSHREIIFDNLEASELLLKNPSDFSLTAQNGKEVCDLLVAGRNNIVLLLSDILKLGCEEGIIKSHDFDFNADLLLDMITRNNMIAASLKLTTEQIEQNNQKLLNLMLNGIK